MYGRRNVEPLPFETASDRLSHALVKFQQEQADKNKPKIVWVTDATGKRVPQIAS